MEFGGRQGEPILSGGVLRDRCSEYFLLALHHYPLNSMWVKIWNQSSNANQIVWRIKNSKVEQEGTGKQPHWSLFTFEAKKVLRWPFWLSDGRTETWMRRLRLQYVVWSALILLKILDLQNNEYLSDWTQVSLCWLIKALKVQIDI